MDCAMLFPGQASQYVGMGRDYYDACEIGRETYKTANQILGFDIAGLSFEGDLEELTKTHNAQPAILVHSVVVYRALIKQGFKPKVVAGHSLGEFSALVAAGFFEFEDALLIVRKRGELMYEAGLERPGTMAAIIGMEEENVRSCVGDAADAGVVVVANINAPAQFAISGEIKAVERAVEIAKERGAKKALKLQVSGAFHSPLMEKTSRALTAYINEFGHGRLDIAWIANVTGTAVEERDKVVGLLSSQLSSPVLWVKSMETLADLFRGPVFEVGPGKVLTGLMKRIVPDISVQPLSEVASIEQVSKLRS
ncbi:MAG: ACP S-malonyltransferase [Candidatus Latescibacterota bacterium]|nr:MAG: ACP S-malonyltransferase [Candidatus Latescibacterota bacterium]